MHLQVSLHHEVARMLQSPDHHLIDGEALTFLNGKGHILPVRLCCGNDFVAISRVALGNP